MRTGLVPEGGRFCGAGGRSGGPPWRGRGEGPGPGREDGGRGRPEPARTVEKRVEVGAGGLGWECLGRRRVRAPEGTGVAPIRTNRLGVKGEKVNGVQPGFKGGSRRSGAGRQGLGVGAEGRVDRPSGRGRQVGPRGPAGGRSGPGNQGRRKSGPRGQVRVSRVPENRRGAGDGAVGPSGPRGPAAGRTPEEPGRADRQ